MLYIKGKDMKTKTIYQCEFCLTEYRSSKEAFQCEADCLKLTMDEYNEYLNLLSEERKAFGQASCRMDDEVRRRCDRAVRAVIEFQEKHGITDNR